MKKTLVEEVRDIVGENSNQFEKKQNEQTTRVQEMIKAWNSLEKTATYSLPPRDTIGRSLRTESTFGNSQMFTF